MRAELEEEIINMKQENLLHEALQQGFLKHKVQILLPGIDLAAELDLDSQDPKCESAGLDDVAAQLS